MKVRRVVSGHSLCDLLAKCDFFVHSTSFTFRGTSSCQSKMFRGPPVESLVSQDDDSVTRLYGCVMYQQLNFLLAF